MAGLSRPGHAALDALKMKANPSKHKSISHERMLRGLSQRHKAFTAVDHLCLATDLVAGITAHCFLLATEQHGSRWAVIHVGGHSGIFLDLA